MSKKTTKSAMSLDERALLVKLSISKWSASKTDNEVTSEVVTSKKAAAQSGRFRKNLIDRKAMSDIQKIASAARHAHFVLTLPWDDDGSRIITTEAYTHYAKTMRDFRIKMEEAVEEFLKGYKQHVKEAKDYLGDMFNKDDYPDVEEIRAKFNFDVEPRPIPASKDFRAKVTDKEAAIIAKDIEARNQQRIDAAMNDVWKRIAEATEKMAEKLREYLPRDLEEGRIDAENVFRDSLIENVKDLASVLPSLNLNNDPKLTAIHDDIVNKLLKHSAADLRVDTKARKRTAAQAAKIADKVSAYML